MKVQISIDDELAVRIDNYAEKNYLSRSGFISLACTQYLAQNEAMQAVKVALAIRKIADTGSIDSETEEQLKDFERFIKMITGQ